MVNMEILSFASLFDFTYESFFTVGGNHCYLTLVITKNDLATRKQHQNNFKVLDYLAAPTKVATGSLKRVNHIIVGR